LSKKKKLKSIKKVQTYPLPLPLPPNLLNKNNDTAMHDYSTLSTPSKSSEAAPLKILIRYCNASFLIELFFDPGRFA
jgi:hypothetical protein